MLSEISHKKDKYHLLSLLCGVLKLKEVELTEINLNSS